MGAGARASGADRAGSLPIMASVIYPPVTMIDQIRMRLVTLADAEALRQAYLRNREHLIPWEPDRDEHFYTVEGQTDRVRGLLAQQDSGRALPWVLADGDRIVGGMTLSNIVLGPFRSASLGYWIDAEYNGRGIATRAVEFVCRTADEHLGLHRIEASTLIENVRSQRVLTKCGFRLIGTAPDYLHINGAWRENRLFQRILNNRGPGEVRSMGTVTSRAQTADSRPN
jgi:ribosomal-protein-alanine N-acetyltransferase